MLGWKLTPMQVFALVVFLITQIILSLVMATNPPQSFFSRDASRLFARALLPCLMAGWLARSSEQVTKLSDE